MEEPVACDEASSVSESAHVSMSQAESAAMPKQAAGSEAKPDDTTKEDDNPIYHFAMPVRRHAGGLQLHDLQF